MTTDLWHSLRSENIGGSEIAALFGESPYTTHYKLWHQKKGNLIADDLDADERVQAGKFKEPGIIAWANYKWKTSFYQPHVYIKHPTVKGMGCTPDALSSFDGTTMAQIKNVDGFRFSQEWESDGDLITKAPLHILLQIQHELECAHLSEGWLIVEVAGNRLLKMECRRDYIVGALIKNAVVVFWDSIEKNEAPAPDFGQDGDVIHRLRKALPVTEILDLGGDEYFRKLAKDALAATVQRNRLQDDVDALNAEIAHLAGNAGLVKCDDMILNFFPHRKNPQIMVQGVAL